MRKALEAEQTNSMLRVNPEVAKVLKSNQNSYLQEIEEIRRQVGAGEERSAAAPDQVRSGVKPQSLVAFAGSFRGLAVRFLRLFKCAPRVIESLF